MTDKNLTPREQMSIDDLDQEMLAMGLDPETAELIKEQAQSIKESKWHANGQLKQVINPSARQPIKPNQYQSPNSNFFQAAGAAVHVPAPELTQELMAQVRKIRAVSGAMRIPGDHVDPESLRITFHPVVIRHEPSNTNRLIPPISFSVMVRKWGPIGSSPVVRAEGSIRADNGALHPHIHSQQGNPCWGEAGAHLNQAVKLADWVMLVNVMAMWAANSKQTGGYVNTLDYFPKTDLPTGYVVDSETWKKERERLCDWEAQETLKTKLRSLNSVRDIRILSENKYFIHFNDVGITLEGSTQYYTRTHLVPGVCCWLTKKEAGWLPVFSKARGDHDRPICHPALTNLVGTEDWDVQYAESLHECDTISEAIEVLSAYLSDSDVCDLELVQGFGTTFSNTKDNPWRTFRNQASAAHKRYTDQPKRRAKKTFDLPEYLTAHGLIKSAELDVSCGMKIHCDCKSGVNLTLKLYPLTITRNGKIMDLDSRTKKRLNLAIRAKNWQRVADVVGSLSQPRRQKGDSTSKKTKEAK